MRNTVMAIAISACASFAWDTQASEPYRYGNLVANIGSEWSATPLTSPGTTLITFARDADKTKPKPTLIWLETAPLVNVSPKDLVRSVAQAIGMRTDARESEHDDHNVHQRVVDASINETRVRASLHSYRESEKLYLLGFIALPKVLTQWTANDCH